MNVACWCGRKFAITGDMGACPGCGQPVGLPHGTDADQVIASELAAHELELPEVWEAMECWAREMLKACSLPQARLTHAVWGVEPGCVYFTTKAPLSGLERARTGLIGRGARGPIIQRIVDGWDLPETVPEARPPVGSTPLLWQGDGA